MSITALFGPRQDKYETSPQRRAARFHNPVPRPSVSLGKTLRIFWNALFRKPAGTQPSGSIPVHPLSRQQLAAAPDRSLYRLGHSTMLLKLRGAYWLTDPVFSERASPFTWMGPRRFHRPPMALQDLPALRGVILSHDHYDHLDRWSIDQLAATTDVFLTPLGVGDRLIEWGVDPAKVRQLDWWQSVEIDGLRMTAAPAQHFSGRTPFDGNRTLWASWAIFDDDLRVFFSGDTGYFEGFKTIGERLGPFDITLMETGAYDEQWPYVHMQPEQTLQAHQDLRGRWLMPVHNGTFDLAMHPWEEPFERIAMLALEKQIPLATPRMGERTDLASPHAGDRWWRGIERAADPRWESAVSLK